MEIEPPDSPQNNYSAATEATKHVLMGELDTETRSLASTMRAAFAMSRYLIELNDTQSMQHLRDQASEWFDDVKGNKKLQYAAFFGGAAITLMAARLVIGDKYDDRVSESLKSITRSIKNKETTFEMECQDGSQGFDPIIAERLDALQESSEHSNNRHGRLHAPGALRMGAAIMRRAISRIPFSQDRNPDEF